jgi:type I restriction enzyme M protein
VSKAFIGVEIDPDAAEAANATIRARFGKSVQDVVYISDALRLQGQSDATSAIRFGTHRCAATNPPFGTKITIKDPAILAGFELARISPRDGEPSIKVYPQAPDTLFLEQNLRLLRPVEGRLAIVVPYQMLSGPKALGVRRWLLRNARVHCVVDLPAETFQPHTGTKGALLVVSRRETPLNNNNAVPDEQIFMAVPRHIGHDRRGNSVYKLNSSGGKSGDILTDFPEVYHAYESYRSGLD